MSIQCKFFFKRQFFIRQKFHSLEVLLTGADVGLVPVHGHVQQLRQVPNGACGQTERGVLDGGDVSVPQDARVCSKSETNTCQQGETRQSAAVGQSFILSTQLFTLKAKREQNRWM